MNDLSYLSPKLAGYSPWKMGVAKDDRKNLHIFVFMEKFGILSAKDFNSDPEHYMKFALLEGKSSFDIGFFYISVPSKMEQYIRS